MRRAAPLALALVACGSPFEDQRDRAWSDSRSRPESVSSRDYPLAVTTCDTAALGATIVAAGGGPASLTTLSYSESGAARQRGTDVDPAADFARAPSLSGALDPVTNGDGVFVVGGLAGEIGIYEAHSGAVGPARRAAIGADACGGAYDDFGRKVLFAQTDDGLNPDLVALAGNDLLLFPDLAADGAATCGRCALTDSAGRPASGLEIASADVGGAPGEEIVVAIADAAGGTVRVMVIDPASVVAAAGGPCVPMSSALDMLQPGPEPDLGASIAVGDADDEGLPEIALGAPSTRRVYVLRGVGEAGPAPGVLDPIPVPGTSGSDPIPIAFGNLDDDDPEELVIGEPLASPRTLEGAGQVDLYSLDADGFVRSGTLFDSAPERDQGFGRAVTIAEFITSEDTDLLVVASRREVFTYFRAVESAPDPRP